MALALSAILVQVNGRRLAALATPGRAQNRQKAGAGRWGGALRAVTPSAAGLSSARPVTGRYYTCFVIKLHYVIVLIHIHIHMHIHIHKS